MKQTLLLLIVISFTTAKAQIDIQCDDRDQHSIYFITTGGLKILRVDSVDTNPTDTVQVATVPTGYSGISINKDLNGNSGNNVMYAASGNDDVYYYWNGSQWVNTGHDPGTVNCGGTTKYIFSVSATGDVYRYNGTADATVLISGLDIATGGAYDVATDKAGNFYIFLTSVNKVICFTENGTPLDTFTTTGVLDAGGSAGFAILGNRMYWIDGQNNLMEGIVTGKTINFTLIKTNSFIVNDLAACPLAGNVLASIRQPDMPRFAVYPNPAHNNARIAMANAEEIQVFDYLGQQILHANTARTTDYTFSVEGWSAGLYLVVATGANGKTAQSKLMVK